MRYSLKGLPAGGPFFYAGRADTPVSSTARHAGRIFDVGARISDEQTIIRDAEAAMMRVTGGVNTHRGAIWALGLLITAAAQDRMSLAPAAVTARAGAIARRRDRYIRCIPLPPGQTLPCLRPYPSPTRFPVQVTLRRPR